MTKNELFLELAQPNEEGVSRWVDVSEFNGRYESLRFGNGADWARSDGSLAKSYIVERDNSVTVGNRVDRVRLNGLKTENPGTQQVRADIRKHIIKHRCVVLGTSKPEVDHKNGRKDDPRVMKLETQRIDDFQPLSKAANCAKRQFCKECEETGERFDAKRLGFPVSVSLGDRTYDSSIGCQGCFWFDPVDFKNRVYFYRFSTVKEES